MNRGPWVWAALVVLLVVGLGFGAWALTNNRPAARNNNEIAMEEPPAHRPANTAPRENPTGRPKAEPQPQPKDPPSEPPKTDPPQPKVDPTPTPTPAPGPDTPKAVTRDFELIVRGTVKFFDQNRAAPGAKVVVEEAPDSRIYDPDSSIPPHLNRAAEPILSKPSGSTVSDEQGNFELKVKLTLSGPAPGPGAPPEAEEEDDRNRARDMSEEDMEAARKKSEEKARRALRGQFRVVATLAGYAPARSDPLFVNSAMYLTDGVYPEKLLLYLAPPAALRGRVVDGQTGQGIASASVALYMVENTGERMLRGLMQNSRTLQCDENGVFTATDLPAARYRMSVSADGYSSVSRFEAGRLLDLMDDPNKELGDIVLLKYGGIKGRVLEAGTGKPIKGVAVVARTGEERWVSNRATTNDKGEFHINSMMPGIYSVQIGGNSSPFMATVPDSEPAEAVEPAEGGSGERRPVERDATPPSDGPRRNPAEDTEAARRVGRKTIERVEVKPGSVVDLGDISLDRGGVLSLLVQDSAGRPVQGAKVLMGEMPKESHMMFMGEDHEMAPVGETGGDGRVALEGLAEGVWKLKVSATGLATVRQNFKFPQEQTEIVVKLSAGGSVRGTVTDARGQGVSGSRIVAISQQSSYYMMYKFQPDALAWVGDSGVSLEKAESGADGVYELAHLAPGKYLVVAFGKIEPPKPVDTHRPNPFGTPENHTEFVFKDEVDVQEGKAANVDFSLMGKGDAVITVVEDGKPVTDIKISVSMGSSPVAMMTASGKPVDDRGVAQFQGLPAGTYIVRTSRDQMEFDTDSLARRRFVVKGGETTHFTLELKPRSGVHLSGQLTMNGKPSFSAVTLVGLDERKSVMKQGAVKPDGKFEFLNVTPGRYELYVGASHDGLPAIEVLDLTREGEVRFDKDFKGYRLGGSVTTPSNSMAERGSVQVLVSAANHLAEIGAMFRGTARVDGEGNFDFGTVPAGKYKVLATLPQVGSSLSEIVVDRDIADLRLNITRNCGDIKLVFRKVAGAQGTAQAFGLLGMEDASGKAYLFSDPQMTFVAFTQGSEHMLGTIAPGTYSLTLRATGFVVLKTAAFTVEVGKVTEVPLDLVAATELRVTFNDANINQELCDRAKITLVDKQGKLSPVEATLLDSFMGKGTFTKPTVVVKNIGPETAQVRVKLEGYAEFTVAVAFESGKLIETVQNVSPG